MDTSVPMPVIFVWILILIWLYYLWFMNRTRLSYCQLSIKTDKDDYVIWDIISWYVYVYMGKKFNTDKIEIDLEIFDTFHYSIPSKVRKVPVAKLWVSREDIERWIRYVNNSVSWQTKIPFKIDTWTLFSIDNQIDPPKNKTSTINFAISIPESIVAFNTTNLYINIK